jgi:hypothetical protein
LGECLKAAAGKGADGRAYIGNTLHKLAHSCFGGLYLANPHGASAAEQGESNSPSRPDLHGIMGMRTPMTDKHPKRPDQLAL